MQGMIRQEFDRILDYYTFKLCTKCKVYNKEKGFCKEHLLAISTNGELCIYYQSEVKEHGENLHP